MPRSAKMRASKSEVHQPDATFPWCIRDVVEMKSNDVGYRGAWFRVEIKRVRRGRNGKLYSTVIYKDFPDESEEEVVAIDVDPVTKEKVLMIRPLPPPAIKESSYDESEELNIMHAVFRDYWEIGDQVDWWYHDCWWLAEVVSVLGDGRFQLKCPSPPNGEGGVYMAKECDMRASLNWSLEEQWTIPPSKEPEMKPCVRFLGPVFCKEIAPDLSLEPEITKEHVEVLRTDVQPQKTDKNKKKDADQGSSTPKPKRKLQLKGEEQSKVRLLDAFENLEDHSQDQEQETCHRRKYMTVDSDDSLCERVSKEPSQVSEQDALDTEEAWTVMRNENSLSDKMATGAGPSGHQRETQPDPESESAVKPKRPRGRPRKDSMPRGRGRPRKDSNPVKGTSGHPVHLEVNLGTHGETLLVPWKKPSKPRAKQKVITEEAQETLRDENPSRGSKVGSEKGSHDRAKLLSDVEVEDVHQIKESEDISMGHMEAGVEGAPEIGVLFDVGLGDIDKSQQSLKDEKKRKRDKGNVLEETRSVKHKSKGSRKGMENANRMEQEQRGFESGGDAYESNVGIEVKAEIELPKSSQKMKKRSSKNKAAGQLGSDEHPVDRTPVYDHSPVKVVTFHEVQKENDNVHPSISDSQTYSKQSGPDEVDRRQKEQQEAVSPKKATMEPTRKVKMPKKITRVNASSRLDLKISPDSPLPDYDRVQEPRPVSSRPGVASDSEAGLQHEDNPVPGSLLKSLPDRHSSKNACLSTNPSLVAVLEWGAEDPDKPATSNDPAISICGSLGSLSDGICSGVLRGDDLNDDIISAVGLDADAYSCSVEVGSSRSRPLDPDKDHSKGLIMNPDSAQKLVDYSSLKNIVSRPVIKYKTVLGRKLVRHARKEIWSKRKPDSKPRTS